MTRVKRGDVIVTAHGNLRISRVSTDYQRVDGVLVEATDIELSFRDPDADWTLAEPTGEQS
jgi:hypothetical protein